MLEFRPAIRDSVQRRANLSRPFTLLGAHCFEDSALGAPPSPLSLQADSMLMPNLHLGRAYALLGDWDKALVALEKVFFCLVLLHSNVVIAWPNLITW